VRADIRGERQGKETRMRNNWSSRLIVAMTAALLAMGCGSVATSPTGQSNVLMSAEGGDASSGATAQGVGPETPNFNLEVVLRGDGFGLVRFRQPNDDAAIVYLDTWLRDMKAAAAYRLQRAVDASVDDDCTSQAWLTLGKGLTPQAITTDERGTGREELWRNLSAFPVGSEFDIHFRVVEDVTQAVVLQSECYQFRISL
jgi:hypothetical protein